jgi:hypothetical protein
MPILKYYNPATSQWVPILAGAKGETGDIGPQGETGPQGIQGIQGIQGEIGPTGPQGPTGPVPEGGTTGQVLGKASDDDFDFAWLDGGGRSAIQLNEQSITANYSIPTGFNGVSAGPITIASGVIVTIPAGSSWSIV